MFDIEEQVPLYIDPACTTGPVKEAREPNVISEYFLNLFRSIHDFVSFVRETESSLEIIKGVSFEQFNLFSIFSKITSLQRLISVFLFKRSYWYKFKDP